MKLILLHKGWDVQEAHELCRNKVLVFMVSCARMTDPKNANNHPCVDLSTIFVIAGEKKRWIEYMHACVIELAALGPSDLGP